MGNNNILVVSYDYYLPSIFLFPLARQNLAAPQAESLLAGYLALEFGISKQQISDIRKNKDKILKFTDNIETSEGLKRKSLKNRYKRKLLQKVICFSFLKNDEMVFSC